MLKKRLTAIILIGCVALISIPLAFADEQLPVDIKGAKSALTVEGVSGAVVVESKADEKVNVAGLTRLAPLLVICEAVDNGVFGVDTVVTVSEQASRIKGPTAFLEAYEKIDAGSLLKSAIMISAGDAIYALAEATAGSAAAFLQKLHAKLQALGIDVSYDDIMGTGTMFSANDLAVLGSEIIKSNTFLTYSQLFYDEIAHEGGRKTELANPNKLVRFMTGCIGVIGSSNEAGYCGVFAVQRSETLFISIVLGSKNSSLRFDTATELTEYAFTAYKTVKIASQGEVLMPDVPIISGTVNTADLVAKSDTVLLLPQGVEYEMVPNVPEALTAPVLTTDTVGTVEYVDQEGNMLAAVELCVPQDIEVATFWDAVYQILLAWLHV